MVSPVMRLSELAKEDEAIVLDVHDAHETDMVARRLRDLGFVQGEAVRVLAHGALSGPMLVQVGFTRFALRRTEADRVMVQCTH